MEGPRTILVLISSQGNFTMRRIAGVMGAANARGWRIHTVSYARRSDGGIVLLRSPARTIAKMIRMWKPDGCIVECGATRIVPVSDLLSSLPCVFVDAEPDVVPAPLRGFVGIDGPMVTSAAAGELFRSDCRDCAFVPWSEDVWWSRERCVEFSRLAREAGKRLHVFSHPPGASALESLSRNLRPWLAALPKPVAVFAVNDGVAEGVLLACSDLGLAVPDSVAVVGVDNTAWFCESMVPTLSSVARDFEGSGAAAVSLLAEMMDEPARVFEPRTCPVVGVVRRGSTQFEAVGDRRVAKALEFIRRNACGGISPPDVARTMCVSRAVADASFRKATGHTILDEIHSVRLRRAQELLSRGVMPDIAAAECGYSSTNDFRRVFRQRVGTTVRNWLRSR